MIVLAVTVILVVGWAAVYFAIGDWKEAREALVRSDVQEVDVLVNGGYHPERLVLSEGRPIRLRVTRTEDGESWWDDLEFPYARVLRWLPEGETIVIDVDPLPPGEYALFCANETMRGSLVIEERPLHMKTPSSDLHVRFMHQQPDSNR